MCKCYVLVHVYGYVCVCLCDPGSCNHSIAQGERLGKKRDPGSASSGGVAHCHALGHASRTGGSCDPASGLQPVRTSTWACLHQPGMIVTEAFFSSWRQSQLSSPTQQALCREDNAPETLPPNSLDASNLGGLDLKVEGYTHNCLHRHLASGNIVLACRKRGPDQRCQTQFPTVLLPPHQ